MAKKGHIGPLLIACTIVLLILFLVYRANSSTVTDMVHVLSTHVEGFATTDLKLPLCPPNYRFFNDAKGYSMCCAGKVDPYTHECMTSDAKGLCAFVPGITNMRDPARGKLPICRDIRNSLQDSAEREFCPRSLPHHANKGRCCANPSDPFTGNCVPTDLRDPSTFCLTTAERRSEDRGFPVYGKYVRRGGQNILAEQLCTNIRHNENAQCPDSSFVKSSNPIDNKGTQMTMCYKSGLGGCYPRRDLERMKTMDTIDGGSGVIPNPVKNIDISKSIMNCDVFKKVKLDKDLTGNIDYTTF